MAGVATPSVSASVKQLSDGNAVGTVLGQSATDKIGFYTSSTTAPVAQASGSNQAALSGGFPVTGSNNDGGVVSTYATSQTPVSVAANTTAEQSITVNNVLSTDLVIINKPTSQAGLGLVSGRVSAANTVKLTFANATAAALTPTATETYVVTTIGANIQLSATLTPAAVAANTVAEQTFTGIVGLMPGMVVQVNKPTTQAGLAVLTARIPASNTLVITYANTTGATLTPTAGEIYEIGAFNGLSPSTSTLMFGLSAAGVTTVAAATTAEQTITEAGIQVTDVPMGASKPTLQAGLALLTGRVSAASTYKATFANVTAGTLTPTTTETYSVSVFRPNPLPILSVTSQTITPTSVAANTTAEQFFSGITGLVSGQPVLAHPAYNLSQIPGVGVAGVRVSATGTLAVTFMNTTSAAITPPPGPWIVGMVNQTTPTAGNYVQQFVGAMNATGATLLNALRSALVNLNLIAGA
jgi:hypothetical protein